jgi:hypothetical protein
MTSLKTVVEATSASFSAGLPQFGFGATPDREGGGSARRWWSRSLGWKTDAIEIVYRGGQFHLPINLHIWFPPLYPEGYRVYSYAGMHVATPNIPQFFVSLRAGAYATKCLALVTSNLEWFDQFSTPQQCLERMTAMTHGGPRKGGPVYDKMVSYLSGLLERGIVQLGASPNGGPATLLGNSGATEGPPSVS